MRDQLAATARHEAAHAVTAYWFGAMVAPNGIDVGSEPICWVRWPEWAKTVEAEIIQTMAGGLAERLAFLPDSLQTSEADILYLADAARNGEAFDIEQAGDDGCVAAILLREFPQITDQELVATWREYENRTLELLRRVEIQDAISTLATALLQRGRMTAEQVAGTLGDSCLMAISCGSLRGKH